MARGPRRLVFTAVIPENVNQGSFLKHLDIGTKGMVLHIALQAARRWLTQLSAFAAFAEQELANIELEAQANVVSSF
jgi:hypothetical protein